MTRAVFLMYHDIVAKKSGEVYSVEESEFGRQLSMLKASGCPVQSVAEFLEAPVNNAVVLTFDDGNSSNLHVAAEMLSGSGLLATFFVTTGFVGKRDNFMNWAEVRRLVDLGMDVGTHGHSHRFLTDVDDEELLLEVRESRQLLYDRSGAVVTNMSFPGGRYNRRVADVVRLSGYRSMSTSEPRVNTSTVGSGVAKFGRIPITSQTDLDTFRRIVEFDIPYLKMQRFKYRAKVLAKQILGNGNYQKLWARWMK